MDHHKVSIAVLVLISVIFVPGCALASSGSEDHARPVIFACSGGVRFAVEYRQRQARITTSEGTWLLEEKASSIGRRFGSEIAGFIHDEDRGALNGLPGGPFRRCREMTNGEPA